LTGIGVALACTFTVGLLGGGVSLLVVVVADAQAQRRIAAINPMISVI
jgi:hypothetical protein